MRLEISARSHVGKVRSKNEDNLCVLGRILPEIKEGNYCLEDGTDLKKPAFLGVFDGMGGYARGERASYVMAGLAARRWQEAGSAQELLLDICREANWAVCEEMRGPDARYMGTTASMLYFCGGHYTICNVGDSPVFLWRDGILTAIHQEHTERATYERVTGKPADPKRKFRLTQNIGMFPEEIRIEPYCESGDMRSGDVFLICSDGITDMVEPEQMIGILQSSGSSAQIAAELEAAALAAGGKDNATVICARVLKEKSLWDRIFGR